MLSQAISRRVENTLPCTSGATFDCQMVWFEPFRKGLMKEDMKLALVQTGMPRPNPIRVAPSSPERPQPDNTPCTLRFGPPQALNTAAPTTPPMAPIELTVPSASSLLPVRARIIGAESV